MDTAKILTELRAQRDRTINAIAALEALNGAAISPAKTATKAASHVGINGDKTASVAPASTKRVVSPEARQRMAEAQKKRYAKAKRAVKSAAKKAVVAKVATTSAKAAPVASLGVKKVGKPMSEATKKKLAVAAKARWAAKSAAKAATAKA
jgi:hypothetical protein